MTNNYKILRIKKETYDKFILKKENIQRTLKKITGRNQKVPMTKFLNFVANKRIYVDDFEIKNELGKRRNKR